MQRLNIGADDREMLNQRELEPGFWSRQFSNTVTVNQSVFDVAIGVILPVFCFAFDPIVFNDIFGIAPLGLDLPRFKVLVYIFSALSILTLLLWLILRGRSGSLNAFIGGILLSGSLCSLLIGIIILPLSVFGLLFLIGILGFTPFLTSFVYLRNAVRAFNAAKPLLKQPKLTASFVLGAVLVIGAPLLVHVQLNRIIRQSMHDLLSGDMHTVELAAQRLKYVAWGTNLDQVVWTYSRETDQLRKDTLAKAYKEITGEEIKTRLAILLD